jgi:hypothetical protein
MDLPRWNACTLEPNFFLRWIECHYSLGSYLQIVAVVIAIAGAALITKWSTERTVKPILDEMRGRAKVAVYRLLPAVASIRAALVRVRLVYDQTDGGMKLAAADKLSEAVEFLRIDTVFPVDVLSELHVLEDKTSEDVAQLYFYLTRYNDFIDRNVPLLRSFDSRARGDFSKKFERLFAALESIANESWHLLQAARPKTQDVKAGPFFLRRRP